SIIAVPGSTKNKDGKRDPEMHEVKEGNEWHFGMKMHIGVDESLGLIHSLETTLANEHDLNVADKLLHGKEARVWADAGYTGAQNRENLVSDNREWLIAMRPGKRKQLALEDIEEAEYIKASVRAKVEHVFFYIKRMFGYSK